MLRYLVFILPVYRYLAFILYGRRWLLSNFLSLESPVFKTEANVCSFPQDTSASHCQVASENAHETRFEINSVGKSSAAPTSNSIVFPRKIRHLDVVHSDQRHTLVLAELSVCQQAAERYRNNYNAWTHRIWVNQHLSCCSSQVMPQ